MRILPQGSAPDRLEARLHGTAPGGIPSPGEIIAAAGGTGGGSGRRAARLLAWGADALRRVGDPAQALLLDRLANAAARGAPNPTTGGVSPATAEDIAALPPGQGF